MKLYFESWDDDHRDIDSYIKRKTENFTTEFDYIYFDKILDAEYAESVLKDYYNNVSITARHNPPDESGYVFDDSYEVHFGSLKNKKKTSRR